MSCLNYGLIKRSTTCYLKVVWRLNNPICIRQDTIFYTVCGDSSNYVLQSSLKDSSFLFYLTLQVSIQQDRYSPGVEKMGKLGSESRNSASTQIRFMGWGTPFDFSHCTQSERKKMGAGPDLTTELLFKSDHGAMKRGPFHMVKAWLMLVVSFWWEINQLLFLGPERG